MQQYREAAINLVGDIQRYIEAGKDVSIFVNGRKHGFHNVTAAKMAGDFVEFVTTPMTGGADLWWKFRVDQVIGIMTSP